MLKPPPGNAENEGMNRDFLKTQFFSLLLCAFASVFFLSAKAAPVLTDEELDYAQIASTISHVDEPYLKGDYVIFTADKNARHVGIAFDFENFSKIHSYKQRTLRDSEFNVKDSLYFYILKLPKEVQSFKYRLVIDGLWTTDPTNPASSYNNTARLTLSDFDASREIPVITEKKSDGLVHFVYKGESGQQVRLGGSFTNWDSWIYELKETERGVYCLNLPLPPGKYEYAYFTGTTSFIDETNPKRCYTQEGKKASLLIVE